MHCDKLEHLLQLNYIPIAFLQKNINNNNNNNTLLYSAVHKEVTVRFTIKNMIKTIHKNKNNT